MRDETRAAHRNYAHNSHTPPKYRYSGLVWCSLETLARPFSFSPFLGGSRVCLGKTFAEITLKFMIPLWYHAFEFELVKEEHKKTQPYVRVLATTAENIPVKFITRNKIPVPKTLEE